jgi:hypothetical protein
MRGRPHGKPREKFVTRSELLQHLEWVGLNCSQDFSGGMFQSSKRSIVRINKSAYLNHVRQCRTLRWIWTIMRWACQLINLVCYSGA